MARQSIFTCVPDLPRRSLRPVRRRNIFSNGGSNASRRVRSRLVSTAVVNLRALKSRGPRRIANCDALAKPCNHIDRGALWGVSTLLDHGINDAPSLWIAEQCVSNLTRRNEPLMLLKLRSDDMS